MICHRYEKGQGGHVFHKQSPRTKQSLTTL